MAIQKSFQHRSGVVLASAYHRVDKFYFVQKYAETSIKFEVCVYKDKESRDSGIEPVHVYFARIFNSYPFTEKEDFFSIEAMSLENNNAVSQCYEWMKTQEDLEGINYTENSIDV